jgi:hypothetical protein
VARYVDEKTHHLRCVLRNRVTGEVLFVVFFKLLFGQELDDTLEREKRDERTETEPTKADVLKKKSTGHDELTKVCAAEEFERRASQQERVRAETHKPLRPADSASAPATDGYDCEDQSYYGQASTAASNLATSVATVYSVLGFGHSSSSSSASEASSRSSSPQPLGQKLMHTEIDDMDDATTE